MPFLVFKNCIFFQNLVLSMAYTVAALMRITPLHWAIGHPSAMAPSWSYCSWSSLILLFFLQCFLHFVSLFLNCQPYFWCREASSPLPLALLGPKFVVFIYLSYPLLSCHFSQGVLQHSPMLAIPHTPSGLPLVPPLSYGSSQGADQRSSLLRMLQRPSGQPQELPSSCWLSQRHFLLHSVAGNAPPTF